MQIQGGELQPLGQGGPVGVALQVGAQQAAQSVHPQQALAPDVLLHQPLGPADRVAAGQQLLPGALGQHLAVVQNHHVLDEVGNLLNQVGGNHRGEGALRVPGQQRLVEQVPVVGVQAQHGLIQQHVGGVGGKGHHNLKDGAVPRGELAHLGAGVQLEGPGQVPGELPVKVGVEGLAPAEGVLHPHGFRVVELLAHQVHLGEGPVVVPDGLAVHGDAAPVGEQALCHRAEQRGLPCAVAAQQAVELPRLPGAADVLQGPHRAVAFG